MKKIVRLTENDITRLVKKVIKEGGYDHTSRNAPKDFESSEEDGFDREMSGTRRRKEFHPTDTEEEIQGVFGSYSDDIPPAVIRYMRKNPAKIIKRLSDIYGERMLDYLPEGPLDEVTNFTGKEFDKTEMDRFGQEGGELEGKVTFKKGGGAIVTNI